MYRVGPKGNEFALCLECALKHQQLAAYQSTEIERDFNHAVAEMEAITGMPGMMAPYPQRQFPVTLGGPVTLLNFHVNESSIGILNTGNLEIVDTAITALKVNSQTQDIAEAISKLATAVADADLPREKKNEAIEILSTVASEATAPEGNRKSSVVKRLLAVFPTLIQTSASAIEIWKAVEPTIRRLFS